MLKGLILENIIKKICKDYNLTYKDLGDMIGYGEEAISKSARTNKISAPMKKACEMLLQIKELESKVAILDELSLILQKLTTPYKKEVSFSKIKKGTVNDSTRY